MYGITIAFSIVLCLLLGEKLCKKKQLDLNIYWGTAFFSILGGIAGSRIYHVLHYWNYYQTDLLSILLIFKGGLGILGGLIGGIICGVLYLFVKKQGVGKWLDLAGVLLPLGQAIGRFGNYFNQEVYGKPTNHFWGIYIPPSKRLNEYINNDIYHPLFAYELILNLLLFACLYLLYTRKAPAAKGFADSNPKLFIGYIFSFYSLGYGLIRYFMEFLKINPWVITNTNVAQFLSTLLILFSTLFIITEVILAKYNLNNKFYMSILSSVKKNILLGLSILGIAISSYLAYAKISSNSLYCLTSEGCDIVQNSPYSTILGIPLGVWGMAYYFILFALFYQKESTSIRSIKKYALIWGLLYSSFLTYIEAFIIQAFCLWCLISFVNIITIYFIYFFPKRKI
ncbi:prolipoprotein diacylglyceryl transferase [candidate division WWE3 bacterium RBG_19FT_COMBO_34_6]|uniref:Phosphatidylglycerol--prolipoprotein diacylglyceryl transferase n=1 Tax=candidate division WWE3 bacterium RBG_19FT_COMBO_34_6 TaxID=1802612 RepID=A0A1F4UKA4_UNCKA|nr:MAG: prolipoprotein diacylglyceryl transferase [candidate division WWE3 bacterium RBG_19FT_COMBO_34_6]